ncbi:MAG: YbhB/YbcL family Raf kinase inhibitor-like protein [candidate division Zixibacteria bacterium]
MRITAIMFIPFVIIALTNLGCADDPKDRTEKEEVEMATLEIISDAFKQGETIPRQYTCDGDDISPNLTWDRPPDGTKELVLIFDDPDAPGGTWDHWIVYNLPPDEAGLHENIAKEVPGGGIQGKNSWHQSKYGGPCPPHGPAHRYIFKLYAVDKKLELPPGATKAEIESAIEGHILAQGELMGKYGR